MGGERVLETVYFSVSISQLALKLASAMGFWGRSCLRSRAREPRELPPQNRLSPRSGVERRSVPLQTRAPVLSIGQLNSNTDG